MILIMTPYNYSEQLLTSLFASQSSPRGISEVCRSYQPSDPWREHTVALASLTYLDVLATAQQMLATHSARRAQALPAFPTQPCHRPLSKMFRRTAQHFAAP